MKEAVELALANVREGRGGPFGALVVRGTEVLARATNMVTSTNDPTAHAEVLAIREACAKLGTFQLTGCDLYASCEPCPMCLGAVYWARPDRLYFAATRQDAARAGFDDEFIYQELGVAHDRRRIPFVHAPVGEALDPFEEWKNSENRTEY